MDYEQVRRFAYILFGVGIGLLGEHVINHGGTDWDITCHGTFGLIAIVFSFILLLKRREKR